MGDRRPPAAGPEGIGRDLGLAEAFVELAGARRPEMPDAQDGPLADVRGSTPDGDDRVLLGRLVGRCVELLDTDDVAVSLLDDTGQMQLIVRTHARTDRVEAAASPSPFRSGQGLVLRRRDKVVGALDLSCRHEGGLPAGEAAVAQALADVAIDTMITRRSLRHATVLNRQLQTALDNRVIVEQAKGILSQRCGITLVAAFEQMRRYARDRNLPVREVARRVIETNTGLLDEDPFATDVNVLS